MSAQASFTASFFPRGPSSLVSGRLASENHTKQRACVISQPTVFVCVYMCVGGGS